uniref:RHS repeat-associated core domain-containing protein n=1 Tax=Argonema antarcticum TaxID=2942763 RepID=UPI0023DF5DE9
NAVELIHDPNNFVETVKDVFGKATTYEYDSRGNILTEIDPLGKVTKRTYDDENNTLSETVITPETGTEGYTTKYTYDSQGNQLTRTNPLNQTDRYTYNQFGQLLTSTDPLGNTTTYTFDKRGNVLSKKDAEGNIISYTYDNRGNALTITEGQDDITKFEYDSYGNRIRKIDAENNQTTYTPDANGNILTETTKLTTPNGVRTLVTTKTYDNEGNVKTVLDAENGLTKYEYDKNGNQTVVIDASGRRTEMRYDDKNQLHETILPDDTPNDLTDNLRIEIDYDEAGNRKAVTDQEGNTTHFKYDPLKRPTEMILPDSTPSNLEDNPRIKVEYDKLGRMKALIDERGNRSEFEYDAAGRMKVARSGVGGTQKTTSTRDAAGREITKTDALNRTTKFVYDNLDRIVETIFPDKTTTKTKYDAFGNVIAQTDQANRTTFFEYDALDRLTAVVDAKQQRTEYKYDEAGNLVYQEDANDRITKFEYDGLGRRTAVVRPLLQRLETVYDKVGNIKRTADFNGKTIEYSYDSLNRLKTKHFLNENRSVQFTYTPTGRRETVTDGRGITTYDYDERGLLRSRMEPDNTPISYTYNQSGLVETITTPSGTTTYRYDNLNRLEKVIDPNNKETIYTYNEVGNLKNVSLPNGTTQTYTYDELNRLKYLENKNLQGNILSSYTYTLDAVGNRQKVEEYGGRKVEYTYDELHRLTKEAIADSVNGDRTISYTYDAVGNRQTKNDSVFGLTTYTYDGNDRLQSETTAGVTTNYTYDNNGNLTLADVQNSPEQVEYFWDGENRLTSVEIIDASGTNEINYRYDADGIRVASIVGGEETRYLVDANRPYAEVLEEYAPGGGNRVSYVHGLDLISQNRNGNKSFYLFDGHSGVRQLTDGLGSVTDKYNYDAFGNLLSSTGNTNNNYLYRGEQLDSNLGWQYLRARYYDPNVGRFPSVDPFEGMQKEPMSRHRYLYGNANPVSYTDPSGLFTLTDVMSGPTLGGILAGIPWAHVGGVVGTVAAGIGIGAGISALRSNFQNSRIDWNGEFSIASLSAPGGLLGLSPEFGSGGALGTLSLTSTSGIEGKWLIVGATYAAGFFLSATRTPVEVISRSFIGTPGVGDLNGVFLSGSFGINIPGLSEIQGGFGRFYIVGYNPHSAPATVTIGNYGEKKAKQE